MDGFFILYGFRNKLYLIINQKNTHIESTKRHKKLYIIKFYCNFATIRVHNVRD